jgi:hypothetical protein
MELTVNNFDTPETLVLGECAICGQLFNHLGFPHGEETGDGLTRQDIIEYLDGRGFREEANGDEAASYTKDH